MSAKASDHGKKRASKELKRRQKKSLVTTTHAVLPDAPPNKIVYDYHDPSFLHHVGPLIRGAWMVPRVLEEFLLARGLPVPAPVAGHLLVDTGAMNTCIALDAAAELRVRPLRIATTYGAGGKHENSIYRARLVVTIVNPRAKAATSIVFERDAMAVPDLSLPFQQMGLKDNTGNPVRLIGLIGRDLLSRTEFRYVGLRGRFELTFLPAGQGGD